MEAVGGATARPVWIDCDPGHDDAFALLLAALHPSLRVLGVSATHGNQTTAKTALNVLRVFRAFRLDHIPVVKGLERPLVRDPMVCAEIHGQTGLDVDREQKSTDGTPLHVPEWLPVCEADLVQENAVVFMRNAIMHAWEESGGSEAAVDIICTGCLTTLAALITIFPEALAAVRSVSIMGGSIGIGNMHPASEWNIQVDPEAARVVCEAALRLDFALTIVPLEVTHTILVTDHILERITKAAAAPAGALFQGLLTFFRNSYRDTFDMPDPPLHDPAAVAFLIAPELFQGKRVHVEIDTSASLCAGRTVCDMFGMLKKAENAFVCTTVEVDKFWDLMISALVKASEQCALT